MAVFHAKNVSLPIMNLVRTAAVPIIQQLHLEERLLRMSSDNWCLINDGTNPSTIVMGVSGKPSELIELKSVLRDRIPVVRRFSGGGTVIVDKGTVLVTLICNKDAVPGLQPYPHPVMSWTGELYGKVLQGIGGFNLRENDYVFGNRKFGGNAQSITRKRWVHHTSFLWDYDARNMQYLKLPARAPKYRSARNHDDFLCPMKEFVSSSSEFIERTVTSLQEHFSLAPVQFEAITNPSAAATHTPSTRLLTQEELEAALAVVSSSRELTAAA